MASETTQAYVCPTRCDDDCESYCHECHDVPYKWRHDMLECWDKVEKIQGPWEV